MCFNKESSIVLFFSSIGFSLYLYKIGDPTLKILAVFTIYIAFMQLIEFFIWLNLECNSTNQFLSKLIPIYLMGQPLVLLLAMYYFKTYNINVNYILFLIFIYLSAFLYLIYDAIISKKKPCITTENSNLIWNTIYSDSKSDNFFIKFLTKINIFNNKHRVLVDNYSILYYITIFLFLLLKKKLYSYTYIFLLLITYILISLKEKPVYSYWCFSINFIPIILILMRLYIKK